MAEDRDGRGGTLRRLGPYMGLGGTFAGAILLGIAAGYWADGKLDTKPWLTLAGALAGLVVAFTNLFMVVSRHPPE